MEDVEWRAMPTCGVVWCSVVPSPTSSPRVHKRAQIKCVAAFRRETCMRHSERVIALDLHYTNHKVTSSRQIRTITNDESEINIDHRSNLETLQPISLEYSCE